MNKVAAHVAGTVAKGFGAIALLPIFLVLTAVSTLSLALRKFIRWIDLHRVHKGDVNLQAREDWLNK
jgi:hypothetical protein